MIRELNKNNEQFFWEALEGITSKNLSILGSCFVVVKVNV